jgi:periplasmic protein CpxP/Spy
MKNILFVFALLLSTITVFAQGGAPKKTAEERAASFVKNISTELSLTADQSTKIQAIQLESMKKGDEIRTKGADGDKKAMRAEMKTVTDAADLQIKTVLTEEQKTKFVAWQEKKKEEMKNRQGGGGGKEKSNN